MSRWTFRKIGTLDEMNTHHSLSPDIVRLALTEAALTAADSLWRAEMRRNYGPEGVLTYAFSPEGQGGLGTTLRRTYEARRVAVALWRHERHRAN
ncbi:hypothetical protein ACRBEV_32775 (plasmid) [Methylobacterium phyllosphaerae]